MVYAGLGLAACLPQLWGMADLGGTPRVSKSGAKSGQASHLEISLEHYLRIIAHRKWLVISVFVIVSAATIAVSHTLPNLYTSETVILVDPQKVPDSYVKATVTGDVRDRLGTLSQQILSVTRLQKIIDTFGLYVEERKKLAREDVILQMRKHITVSVVSDFGGSQDLQAFRISYSGKDARLVAQVTNELASLFIEENLKAREQQAEGTTEFLTNQLSETRKKLEEQEAQLRDFKLKHIGEMPEQQTADLQILGQLQSQLQAESDALNSAEQQRTYLQSMMVSQAAAPVVDLDQANLKSPAWKEKGPSTLSALKSKLSQLLMHYSDKYPDVVKLRKQIADEEANEGSDDHAGSAAAPTQNAEVPVSRPAPVEHFNPVLQSQLEAIEVQIAKHKTEYDRLAKLISQYQAKVEAIPVREQEINQLVRDYETSKAHYSQLLEKQLSAETATQLEIRQKGEQFSILDPAQPAERPSQPNRKLIDAGGCIAGVALGLILAVASEFVGMSIATAEQLAAVTGIPVLEVIPIIRTPADRLRTRRRLVLACISATGMAIVFSAVYLFHSYRSLL